MTGSLCFLHRQRLAGQHRLVALEPFRQHEPEIGGHDVADPDPDEVTWDELGHVDRGRLSRSHRERAVPQLRVEGLGPGRLTLCLPRTPAWRTPRGERFYDDEGRAPWAKTAA